jgi:low affinity Fe/Cu permease
MSHAGIFYRFASRFAHWAGRPLTLFVAMLLVAIWASSGPIFGFSDTWQLVINTSTTIITFLMVFIVQSSQNRDTHAMQIKLDELIRATTGAHNALLDLEELSEDELAATHARYEALAREARQRMRDGDGDTGSPKVKAG